MTRLRAYGNPGMLRAIFGVFFCVIGIALGFRELLMPSEDSPWPLVFLVVWTLLAGYVTWQGLGVPRVIEWPEGEAIKLRSARGTFTVVPHDILSIRPMADLLVLEHRSGKHYLNRNYDGLSEFITRLKRENPTVEVRGV